MTSSKPRYLLNLNALVALADPDHQHHKSIQKWFMTRGKTDWGVCPLTEAGFVRVTTHPAYSGATRSVAQAAAVLADFATHKGFRYWAIADSWAKLTAPFSARIVGHQQVTDSYLLGMVVKEKGVLVTFDKGIKYLAGTEYQRSLLVLE